MKNYQYYLPTANISEAYENPDGEKLNPCQYCAFCERFACEYDAKASPEVTVLKTAQRHDNFELRTHCNVVEVLTDDDDDSKVTGVKYVDTLTKEEFIQPADIVVLTSYVFNNYKRSEERRVGKEGRMRM